MNYEDCVAYIDSIPRFAKKTKLSNTIRLFEILHIDRGQSGIIHVAGTNGKGSVCTYIAGVLEEAGYRTALFLSPHLVRIEERIQINGQLIKENEFCMVFEKVKRASEQMVQEGYFHPAYFEFLFGMAMVYFVQEQVDFIVLETGLGGRLDATNIFLRPLLTVITPIKEI